MSPNWKKTKARELIFIILYIFKIISHISICISIHLSILYFLYISIINIYIYIHLLNFKKFLNGGPRFNKSLAGCLEKAKPSPKLGRMGVGRAVEGTKWPVWAGQADSCNYIRERSCPRQWKMKSISVTHGLVHKSKRGSSLSTTCKKPQSPACSKKLKYTLSWLLGREANILGGLHIHARAAKHSQGYSLPRGEENYQGGKNINL